MKFRKRRGGFKYSVGRSLNRSHNKSRNHSMRSARGRKKRKSRSAKGSKSRSNNSYTVMNSILSMPMTQVFSLKKQTSHLRSLPC